MAHALQDPLKRYGDFVSRYGGEEFAAVLPNTEAKGSLTVANQMRANVHDLSIPHVGSEVASHVTVSIGAACVVPKAGSHHSDLITLADQTLYRAKQEGRNRIAFAG